MPYPAFSGYVVYGIHTGDRIYRYIGITSRIEKRVNDHRGNHRTQKVSNVGRWIGENLDEVQFEIIQRCESSEEMKAWEIVWISQLRGMGHDLLNLNGGGQGQFEAIFSDETKSRMSASAKARIVTESPERRDARHAILKANGESRPFLGRKHSAESLARQSATKIAAGRSLGENNVKAKLTERQAVEIIARLDGGEGRRSVAADYPVSLSSIHNIASGNTWKHLRGENQL